MFKVVSRKPISIHEAKELLEKTIGEEEEQDQLFMRTLDYLNKFAKIDGSMARRVIERLIIEVGLTEEEAVELVNILPKTVEETRTLTIGWRKLLTTDQVQQILDIMETETGEVKSK